MLLFASVAALASAPVEIAIPEQPTPLPIGTFLRRVRANVSLADQVVATSDDRVSCVVKDGAVSVRFSAEPGDWPTAWPVKTRCELGDETLKVHVVKQDASVDLSKQNDSIVSDTVVLAKPAGSFVLRGYALPEGPTYTPGSYDASLAGVQCSVHELDGVYSVTVSSPGDAASGIGSCTLPTADTSYVLALDLSEVVTRQQRRAKRARH